MKTNYLLPNRFKTVGWILFIPGFLLGIAFLVTMFEPEFLTVRVLALAEDTSFGHDFFTITENNIIDEIIGILLITGCILIAFSKEKSEDEYISKIRLESLVWAVYVNYLILLIALLFVFGVSFFWVLVFNMFTILFFFLIRFNWTLYKFRKSVPDEK